MGTIYNKRKPFVEWQDDCSAYISTCAMLESGDYSEHITTEHVVTDQ